MKQFAPTPSNDMGTFPPLFSSGDSKRSSLGVKICNFSLEAVIHLRRLEKAPQDGRPRKVFNLGTGLSYPSPSLFSPIL